MVEQRDKNNTNLMSDERLFLPEVQCSLQMVNLRLFVSATAGQISH